MQQESHSFDEHESDRRFDTDSTIDPAKQDFAPELRSFAEKAPDDRSLFDSIRRSPLTKALGLGLLASPFVLADLESEQCEMPQIPVSVSLLANTVEGLIGEHQGVEVSIVRQGQSFEGSYGEREVSGTINAAGDVESFVIDGHKIVLEVPRSFEHHVHQLRHFDAALKAYESHEQLSDIRNSSQAFTSYDGVHIEFTHEREGSSRSFVLAKSFVAEVSEAPTAGAQRSYQEAVEGQNAFESAIAKRVQEHLPEGYDSEQELRAARTRLLERSAAVDAQMQVYLDKYQDVPDKKQEWVAYQSGFHEKRAEHVRFFQQNRPDKTDEGSYRQHIRDFQKVLASYESYLSITPTQNEFSTAELLRIAERLERNEGVNARRQAIIATDSGLSQQQRQSFESEWVRLVSQFNKDYGWERWDPNSLSQEQYNRIIQAVDAHCATYESLADIEGAERDATIVARFDGLRSDYDRLSSEVTTQGAAASTYELTLLGTDTSVVLRRPLDEPGTLYIERQEGDVVQIDKYKDGHHYNQKRTNETLGEKQVRTYHRNGRIQYDIEYDFDEGSWDLHRQKYYTEDGKLQYLINDDAGSTTYYSKSGSPLITIRYNESRTNTASVSMSRVSGQGELGLYAQERAKGTVDSTSAYLDLLAKELNTPERLHAYFDNFMNYTSDGPSDNWQRSSQTVQRTAYGRMLGDCDDYAFLARDILRRQDKNAHVVYIPGHAICLWVEKDESGKYHAHTIGTYGYDHNGNRFEEEHDATKARGYSSVKDAVNAVFKKYEKADTGLEEGTSVNVNDGNITIMTISSGGSRTYSTTSLDYLMRDVD